MACGLRDVLPAGPVSVPEPLPRQQLRYTGPPRVDHPVLPLQVFGLHYDLDLVLVSKNPAWDMHEYARIQLPGGPLWIAKDTDPSGVQTIVADLPDIEQWIPEIPAPRQRGVLEVDDRSDGDHIDVSLSYENPRGQSVQVDFEAKLSSKPPRRRNGNTMGHSKDIVAVVLDLERQVHAHSVRMTIDGQRQRIQRLLGIYPFKFLLRQTQGGLAITSFVQRPAKDGFLLERPIEPPWPTQATEHWRVEGDEAVLSTPLLQTTYRFEEGGLSQARVNQHAQDQPIFTLRLSPALPDVRRPFEGIHTSRFVMDVGEQQAHGVGLIAVRWVDADTVEVRITPQEPRWLHDRPMVGWIHYRDDAVEVITQRVD